MTLHHDNERMTRTIAILNGLGELVSGRRGADALKHTILTLDAVQAIYELPDVERHAVESLIDRYHELYDSYLTVRQVAAQLNIRPRVVKWLARKGALSGIKRDGKWVFRPKAVEKFVNEHTYRGRIRVTDLERETADD